MLSRDADVLRLDVGTFGGASALPLRVAIEQGYLAEVALEIRASVAATSADLREALGDGSMQIIHASPDNVIAWADAGLVAQAWLAGSNGPIDLLARTARSVEELRGRRLAVDARGSGFAPILRRMLRSAGVGEEDVELVELGATRLRFAALRGGEIEATLLTTPWSILAAAEGASRLASHVDVAPGLLTSCAASLTGWLTEHADAAIAYLRALERAMAWLRDPDDRSAAVSLIGDDMDLDPASAAATLDVMLDADVGWPSRLGLVGTELEATWQLRAETAPPARPAGGYVHVVGSGPEAST